MRKKLHTVVLAITLLAVLVSPVLAINFGERDNGEHPYVALLFFPVGDAYGVCSGTLIAPDVVLTAAHCASIADVALVTFDEVPVFPIAPPNWITGTPIPHPDFVGLTVPNTNDVGVVLLDTPVTDIAPAQIAPLGYLESFQNQKGLQDTIFVPVGYGLQSRKPTYEWDLARYKGEQRIINLVSFFNGGYNVQLTNNPGKGNGEGGTCSGDSGGPILHQGDLIVAVNSFGIAPHCKGNDFAYRVDIPNSQEFLSQFVTLP